MSGLGLQPAITSDCIPSESFPESLAPELIPFPSPHRQRQTQLHWTRGPQAAPRAPPLQLRMIRSCGGRAEPLWPGQLSIRAQPPTVPWAGSWMQAGVPPGWMAQCGGGWGCIHPEQEDGVACAMGLGLFSPWVRLSAASSLINSSLPWRDLEAQRAAGALLNLSGWSMQGGQASGKGTCVCAQGHRECGAWGQSPSSSSGGALGTDRLR